MGQVRKRAHIRQWRGKPYLIFYDYTQQPPVERRLSCEALDVKTPKGRTELVKQYALNEKIDDVEVAKRGGALAYTTLLIDALTRFKDSCEQRAKARIRNPKRRRGTLSVRTRMMLDATVDRFCAWLAKKHRGLQTRHLSAEIITGYLNHYGTESERSEATVSMETRHLRVAIRALDDMRPPLFPDFRPLAKALRPAAGATEKALAFEPSVLTAFLRAALEREAPGRAVAVKRKRLGKIERFKQTAHVTPAVPVSHLFLLSALTGARLGEILALKWRDVDLVRGRIVIHAQKTGMTRIVPLIGAPEGIVAPKLLDLLRVWKLQAGKREYVLPHAELDAPVFPKGTWQAVNKDAEVDRIGPQMLRKNFTSYAASMGIPPAVCAQWQGHGAQVAERYYRQQVLDRQEGDSLEQAMGLEPIIGTLAGASSKSGLRAMA